MFKKNFGSSKGFKKNEGKGGTRPRGFVENKKKTYQSEVEGENRKTFSKFNNNPFNKNGKPQNRVDMTSISKTLGNDVITRIKITNPKLLNGHIIELNDYVDAKTNNYLKEGDKLLKCKWQLKRIKVRTAEGVQSFDLKGKSDTFKIGNRIYLVQMLFEEISEGKHGMRICVNGFESYALLRDFDSIELTPVFNQITDLSYITIRAGKLTEDKSLNIRRLELKITDSQMDKLEYIRQKTGKDCIADVVRSLIANAE